MSEEKKSIYDIPITSGVLSELAEIDSDERLIDTSGERTQGEQQEICNKIGKNFYNEFLPALDDTVSYDAYPEKMKQEIEGLKALPLGERIATLKRKLNGTFMVRINVTSHTHVSWKNKMEICRKMALESFDKTLAERLGKRATAEDIFIPSPKVTRIRGKPIKEYEGEDEEENPNFDELEKLLRKALKNALK